MSGWGALINLGGSILNGIIGHNAADDAGDRAVQHLRGATDIDESARDNAVDWYTWGNEQAGNHYRSNQMLYQPLYDTQMNAHNRYAALAQGGDAGRAAFEGSVYNDMMMDQLGKNTTELGGQYLASGQGRSGSLAAALSDRNRASQATFYNMAMDNARGVATDYTGLNGLSATNAMMADNDVGFAGTVGNTILNHGRYAAENEARIGGVRSGQEIAQGNAAMNAVQGAANAAGQYAGSQGWLK